MLVGTGRNGVRQPTAKNSVKRGCAMMTASTRGGQGENSPDYNVLKVQVAQPMSMRLLLV